MKNIISLDKAVLICAIIVIAVAFALFSPVLSLANSMVPRTSAGVTAYFNRTAPHDQLGFEDVIISQLQKLGPSKSAYIAMYDFISESIAQQISDLANSNGNKFYIVISSRGGGRNNEFALCQKYFASHQNIQVRTHSKVHDKYLIFDNIKTILETCCKIVVTGSANWTATSFNETYNNLLVIESNELYDQFKEDFDNIWEHSIPNSQCGNP